MSKSLPDNLKNALLTLLNSVPRQDLIRASEELTLRYRSSERDKKPVFMTTEAHRMAYLAVRMPATFAAVSCVLKAVERRMPDFSPKSLCDLGAGPGTASWAAVEAFSDIADITLFEKDSFLAKIGKNLMQNASHPAIRKSFWKIEDVVQSQEFGAYSLVILSYMIGELANESLELLLQKAWDSASEVLVVIEPGTMHGFERIRKAREWLIKQGGFLVAPCPHHGACPIPKGDWCHFSVRLERSSLHMVLKDASLGYEDEKFSYVVASKKPVELPQARILRHPQHHSGHIDLTLCAQEGLIKKTVSKRHGEAYKKARKAEWGDIWNE